MANPVLSSVSPSSVPPGATVTAAGSGFDAGARVGIAGALLATTFVSSERLTAVVPADLAGPAGSTSVVSVFVENEDGTRSGSLPLTVRFAFTAGQSWTSLDAVCGEVPQFKRGGTIKDATILGWMRSIAQTINGIMLKRGLSLSPAEWTQAAAANAMPDPASVLELINRYGAAARLAYAVGAQFGSGEWGFAKHLQGQFEAEKKALENGSYDVLFRPAAAVAETGARVAVGDVLSDDGETTNSFTKQQVF